MMLFEHGPPFLGTGLSPHFQTPLHPFIHFTSTSSHSSLLPTMLRQLSLAKPWTATLSKVPHHTLLLADLIVAAETLLFFFSPSSAALPFFFFFWFCTFYSTTYKPTTTAMKH